MDSYVLQNSLPHAPWSQPQTWKMPGIQVLNPATWLLVDEAFSGQMALRDHLIADRPKEVHAVLPEGRAAAEECLDLVLAFLGDQPDYRVDGDVVVRPDGVEVRVAREVPLITLGRLIQEDVCLMQPGPDGHILAGALLCFPSAWTLAEKIGRPLVRIHRPVAEYDDDTARRVQRLFDRIQVGYPMWRANAFLYDTPELFTPRREGDPSRTIGANPRFLRSERQTLRRLAKSGAVAFLIHTYMVKVDSLTEDQRIGLDAVRRKTFG